MTFKKLAPIAILANIIPYFAFGMPGLIEGLKCILLLFTVVSASAFFILWPIQRIKAIQLWGDRRGRIFSTVFISIGYLILIIIFMLIISV